MATLAELLRKRKETEAATNRIISGTLTETAAGGLGQAVGRSSARQFAGRQNTLRQLLNKGELQLGELGPRDRQVVGPHWLRQFQTVTPPREKRPNLFGIGGDVGESTKNLLTGFAGLRYLPQGLFELGKGITSDISRYRPEGSGLMSFAGGLDAPETKRLLIDPEKEYFKHKYSGSPKEIGRKTLIEDPFGTLLDVGALLTLGAGSAAKVGKTASRAGQAAELGAREGSILAKTGGRVRQTGEYLKGFGYKGTRGKRPDLLIGKSIKVPREFGMSPLVRTGQRLTDKYGRGATGAERGFAGWRARFAQYVPINTIAGRAKILSSHLGALHSKKLTRTLKKLSDKEGFALVTLKNAISPQPVRPRGGIERGMISSLDAYKEVLDSSLVGRNAPGYNAADAVKRGADIEFIRAKRKALDDPEIEAMINNPEQYPDIVKASDIWDEQVERNLQTLNIPAEEHMKRVFGLQGALRLSPEKLSKYKSMEGVEAIKDPVGSFDRFAARHAEETGQEFPVRPNWVPHSIAEGKFTGDLSKIERAAPIERVAKAESVVSVGKPPFLMDSDLRAIISGGARIDTGLMREHIGKRERFLQDKEAIAQITNKLGEKDANGELIRARTPEEAGFSSRTHEVVPVEGVVQFFKQEVDATKIVNSTFEELRRDAPGEVAGRIDKVTQGMNEFLENDARRAVREVQGATASKGVVMTKPAAKSFIDTWEGMRPDRHKAFRGYDRTMGTWRMFVLFFSPRWWLNTFAGSAFLSGMSGGLLNPRYLVAAARYSGNGDKAAKLMEKAPEHKPGIRGIEIEMEESRRFGVKRDPFEGGPIKRAGQKIATKVENMESFFKRIGLFQQLDKQGRAAMHQAGEVLDGYSRGWWMKDEYIDNLLNHPQMLDGALNEWNRFFYNYNQLGPVERKWFRRAQPFWGWYKFVTKLVYQLPFQYPGRMHVLNTLSSTAQEFEESELGIIPNNLKGAIFLNKELTDTKYLPTFGLNPFADFANPAAPEGTLQGMLNSYQLAPLFSAAVEAMGLSPTRGQITELSPESGYLQGPFGRIIDPKTGEEVPGGIGSVAGAERFLGGLARSLPQVKALETIKAGGRYVYPESIFPFSTKPVPVEAGEAYGEGGSALSYLLTSLFGAAGGTRTRNLREYQNQLKEDVEYGRSRRKGQLKRLRKSGLR